VANPSSIVLGLSHTSGQGGLKRRGPRTGAIGDEVGLSVLTEHLLAPSEVDEADKHD